MSKQRIVELQKALKIARTALERIKSGHHANRAEGVAEDALYEMMKLEPKQQLQGLVEHNTRFR